MHSYAFGGILKDSHDFWWPLKESEGFLGIPRDSAGFRDFQGFGRIPKDSVWRPRAHVGAFSEPLHRSPQRQSPHGPWWSRANMSAPLARFSAILKGAPPMAPAAGSACRPCPHVGASVTRFFSPAPQVNQIFAGSTRAGSIGCRNVLSA